MKTNDFKHTCIRLRKRGYALGKIVKITGRPKTSVYFHIRGIELTGAAKKIIAERATKRINNFNKKRRGKSTYGRSPRPFTIWTNELVSLISHLLFDGEIKASGCAYSNRNLKLIEEVKSRMQIIYNYLPNETESTPGVHRISYYSVELGPYVRRKANELLRSIKSMPPELKRSFLRSFFDDEGSICFSGGKRLVRGYQHSTPILRVVHTLLNEFNISSKIDKKYHEIVISRKENLERFRDRIGFSRNVSINPERKNSIWKRPLEKQEILRMALNSYQ